MIKFGGALSSDLKDIQTENIIIFSLQLRREMLIVQFPREKFVIAVDKIQFVIRCSLSITLKLKTLKFTGNLVVVSIGHRKEF